MTSYLVLYYITKGMLWYLNSQARPDYNKSYLAVLELATRAFELLPSPIYWTDVSL